MACEEVAHSRPLFLTIYTVVIVGVVVSSLYVFSAIHYSSTTSSAWSSFPPLSSNPFIYASFYSILLALELNGFNQNCFFFC